MVANSSSQDLISATLASGQAEATQRPAGLKPMVAPTASKTADPDAMDAGAIRKFAESDEGQRLIAQIKNDYQKAVNQRKTYEQKWYKNLDMYRGQHFTRWMPQQQRMGAIVAPNWDRQPVINIIRPIIRTEVAKTTSQQPNASVSPATNDEEDVLMAQAGESAWRYQYDQSHFHTETFQPADFWRANTGNGFIKNFIDWSECDIPSTEAKKAELSKKYPGAEPFIATQKVYGVIKHEVITPFHIYVSNLEETSLQKQRFVMHVIPKPLEQARRMFKQFVPDDWSPSLVSAASILDISRLGDRSGNNANADSVLIMEVWVKPGTYAELPHGGLITLVGDQIVYLAKEGIPYAHGEYPFAHLTGISTGLFYRESVITDLISPQNELNLTYAQIIKAKNLASKPQMYYVAGSLVPKRITSKPGLYIEVTQGFEFPKPVPLQDMPSYVQNFPQQLRAVMEDISGQHDVSRGEAPTSGASATMIAYLGERDDSYLSEVFKGIEAAVETVARQYLSMAVQYWDEPRLVKIVGMDGANDARMLKGADIGSGTDIRVESGSALPISKAARLALITEWMKLGFITVEQGMKALQMGMVNQLLNTIRQDESQAQRENIRMKEVSEQEVQLHALMAEFATLTAPVDPMTGQQAPPPLQFPINEFDNHAVHLETHGSFMKSQAYEQLDDAHKQVFLEHWRAHLQALGLQQVQQSLGAPETSGPATPEPGAQQNAPAYAGIPAPAQ